MKKIKQFSLKATLLTIVAALTIGFTGCTDEFAGDPTTGKPGYLTVNVKTLKPKVSKSPGDTILDYTLMNDLNIFLFDASGNKLQQKYVSGGYTSNTAISMQVGTIPTGSKVVVVANYGSAITGVTTYANLTAKEIETVRNFSTLGLHMTGEANVSGTGTYESHVNVAPVESKITVKWTLAEDAANYVVTGVYVVNAINKTTLPIIRQRSHTGDDWTADNASDIAIASNINAGTRTASFGLTPEIGRDYNFYTGMTDLFITSDTYLKDTVASTLFTSSVDSTYMNAGADADSLNGVIGYHYYVGENYHADLPNANGGIILSDNTTNANTIVVIRVTPKSDAPTYIKQMGHKFYTYDFSNSIANNAFDYGMTPAGTPIITGWTAANGFSTKRKTNYNLTFALTSIGASDPFVRLNTLNVYVIADPWENSTVGF